MTVPPSTDNQEGFDEINLATALRSAAIEEERARRLLFKNRRRVLLAEGDPLDGALLIRQLEEFRKTHKVKHGANTGSGNGAIAFRVGARIYGEPNEIFDFPEFTMVKQHIDTVTVVAGDLRLTFVRQAPNDFRYNSPRWTLEGRMILGGERNGTRKVHGAAIRRSGGHTIRC